MTARFARCRLDTHARRLFRGAREVHLSPKAFAVLRLLIENRHRAVAKSELLDRVWPGVFVSDGSLARVVNEVRRAIGDRARRARLLRTVHGYGYAFVAHAEQDGAERHPEITRPAYWFVADGRTYAMPDGESMVGRDPDCRIWLDSPKVSRRHARVVVRSDQVTIEDLGAKNGTLVGGRPVAGPVRLRSGDEISVGPFRLTFRVTHRLSTTETEDGS
jgi:DNA-binding winged helix-turn-helix (wHTH) protein